MTRWEYLCEHINETGKSWLGKIEAGALGEHLNQRGQDGWELVSVLPATFEQANNFHGATLIFQREQPRD